MGRGVHCSEEERRIIRQLKKKGKTYKEIQEILNCSAKMISNALKWQKKPETRGRKKKTSDADDRRIVKLVKKDPFATSTEIISNLNLNISASSVRKRLIKANLYGRRPAKTPLLTGRHINLRLNFAKEHVEWPTSKWRNILWSDETKVELFSNDSGKKTVRRPKNKKFDPKYTTKTVKHGGGSILIWACFSHQGVGPIFRIENVMTANEYVNILENVMLPYAEEEMPLKWVYQQDNDPKHTSKKAKDWFRRNNINVLSWPPQSPDLNPIENLWIDLKKNVARARPTNLSMLWETVESCWNMIPVEKCQSLVKSMPNRCQAVLNNKGYTTKY